jgi:hypothetical protein
MCILKRARVILLIWLFFYAINSQSQSYRFVISEALGEVQTNLILGKLPAATKLIQQEKKAHPENLAWLYLENHLEFLEILMYQDPEIISDREKKRNIKLETLEKIPEASAYHLFAKAQYYLQWAIIYTQHERYLNAAVNFRNAYHLLQTNIQKHPDFLPNKKELGLIKAVLGAVPENFKWVLNLTGFKGNTTDGINWLKEAAFSNAPPEQQIEKQFALYYLILTELHYSSRENAWQYCNTEMKDLNKSLISVYVKSYIALKTGHTDEGIATLQKRPQGQLYPVVYLFDYLMGVAKLQRMDYDADVFFKKFVSFYNGKELIKDAYKRLSWYYLIHNSKEKYEIYKGLAQKYGADISNEEKVALKEDLPDYTPHPQLLKGRLLFDGGYYQQAEQIFKAVDKRTLVNQYQQIEYTYRYARVLHEQKKVSQAVDMYLDVIEQSKENVYYFAPNSCLQLGYIHEKLGFKQTALYYYKKVVTYKNYEYKLSITQKAKAAISRLEN